MLVIHPSYYDDAINQAYPFDASVARTNNTVTIDNDVFVDARVFVPNGTLDVYISKITIAATVQIVLASSRGDLGYATFERSNPPDTIHFWQSNTYLGLMQANPGTAGTSLTSGESVSDNIGLAKLCSWPDGTYSFLPTQTRLAATVVVPQPQSGVRKFILSDGTGVNDEVVLVGERGVQLTVVDTESSSSNEIGTTTIRVDIVGDPLFVRRACEAEGVLSYANNQLLGLKFDGDIVRPNAVGGIKLSVKKDADSPARPALRITVTDNGLIVGFING